ncbi:MAG TPA: Ig-like domain-containing protein [Rubrobacter sp.]|nr:Ig-like domain-containing protein [Rubrobacter sp.]
MAVVVVLTFALALALASLAAPAKAQDSEPPPPDTTPPTVVAVSPADGAATVDPADNVTATFSEPMDPATVDATTFTLTKEGSAQPVEAAVTYQDSPASRATLSPDSPLSEGAAYTARIETGATDVAGNQLDANPDEADSQPKVWSFTVADVTDPTVTLDVPAPGVEVGNTMRVEATATDNLGVDRVEFVVDGTTRASDTTAPYSAEIDMSGYAQGTSHAVFARAVDASGNEASSSASTVTLDREVSLSLGPSPAADGLTNDSPAELSFTTDADVVKRECRADSGAFAPCSSPYAPTLTQDGPHTYEVRVTDDAGNEKTLSRSFTLDRTAPDLTIGGGPDGGTFGPNTTQTWSFQAPDTTSGPAGFQCSVTAAGAPQPNYANCSAAGAHSVSNLSGGPYEFKVKATDRAGNESVLTRRFTIDATAPTVSLTSPEAGQRVRNSVDAAATVADGDVAEVEFLVDGAVRATDTTAPYSAPLDVSGLVHGATPSISARATDNVGNAATSDARSVTVDRDVSLSLGEAPRQGGLTNAPRVPLTFATDSDVPAANQQCRAYRTGATAPGPFGVCASPFDPTLSDDGGYTYEVRVADDLGNTRTLSRSFTLDRTQPNLAVSAGPAGQTFGPNTTQRWTFSATDVTSEPATVECSVVAQNAAPSYGPCSTGTSHSVSNKPDGSYVFGLRATDGAGNTRELTRSFRIDAVAPTASLTAPGAGAKVGASMEVAATASDAVSAAPRVEFLVDGAVRATANAAPYAATVNMAALAHGSEHTVAVRATDDVGNRSVLSERTVTVDLRTDVVLGDTPAPDGFTRAPSAPLSFTTDADVAERECRATRSGSPAEAFAPCTSPFAPDLAQDGRYAYEVRVTDDVGNTDTKTRAFTIDRTNPTLSLTGGPDGGTFGPNTRQAWTFASGDATSGPATVECAVAVRTAEGTPNFAYGPCEAAGSHSVTNGPDDRTYLFSVRATDKADNQTVVTTAPIRIDATRPTVDLTAPANGASFGSSMRVSATAADDLNVQRVQFMVDGTVRREVTAAPYAADLNVQTLTEGRHTVSARAVDGVGNTSTLSEVVVIVDRQISLTLGSTPAHGSLTNAPRVPLAFATDSDVPAANQRCQIRLGGAVVRPFEVCASPFDPDLTDDGTYTYDVQVRDEAGNPLTRSRTFTLDRTAPTLTVNGPEDDVVVGPDSSMTWALIEDDATTGVSRVECGVARAGTRPTFAVCDVRNAPYTISNAQRADGDYAFTARAVDGVGNTTEVVRRFTVDRTPPVVEITSGPADGASTNGGSAAWSFSSTEPDATFECRVYGENTTPGPFGACSGADQHAVDGLAPGTHVFEVRGVDAFGNRLDGPSVRRTLTVDVEAPRVLAFTPKDRAVNVSASANVVVNFSEGMDAASLDRTNFRLTRAGSAAPVLAKLSLNPSADKATLNPVQPLRRGTTYKVTVAAGARDLAGNALGVGRAWTFKVKG